VRKTSDHIPNVLYGKYPVFMALRSRAESFISIHTSNSRHLREYVAREGIGLDCGIVEKNNAELSKMLGASDLNHQGYVAFLRENRKIDFDEFIDEKCSANDGRPKLLILDELTDPHNVGAIVRTAAAFGVNYLIKTKYNSPRDMSVISKASAGMSELMNILEVININRTIEILKKSGYFVLGLCGKSEKNLKDVSHMTNLCLIVGNEGRGLRSLVRRNCDALCGIRMKNIAVESLNVSVAAALAIYELWG
jgi:23S rRNA (guanosine2251-2'-O)-methyltransferase